MLSRAQNTFHHNPRLRGPVSSTLYMSMAARRFPASMYSLTTINLPAKRHSNGILFVVGQ